MGGCARVTSSPWVVFSATGRGLKPPRGRVERCLAGRGEPGLTVVLLVLLRGRSHCLVQQDLLMNEGSFIDSFEVVLHCD